MPAPVTSPVYSGMSKRDADVALRAEVVDLVGLELVEQLDQRGRVGQVAVVEEEPDALLVRVVVEVVDAVRC